MDVDRPNRVVQFQIIRGPDQMVGSKNDGGARLFFFALDASGQLWRGTAATELSEPAWSRLTGPLQTAP
jgi:hypothetical protein